MPARRGPRAGRPATAVLLLAAAALAAAPALAGDALAQHDPPLRQHERAAPQAVACNEGLVLVVKSSDGSPACVGEASRTVLLERGWAAPPPAPSIGLTAEERARLADDPIRATFDPYWPPFDFADADGEIDGLSGAYLAEFERLVGADFVVVPSPDWPGALDAVRAGEADVLFVVDDTPERREFMAFAPPHTNLPYAMITLGADVEPGALGALDVGIISEYEVASWLDENRPDVAYVELGEGPAFAALQSGDIDVLLWFWEIADYKARLAGVEGLHNAGELGHSIDLRVGYALGDPVLESIVEKAMAAITEEDMDRMLAEAVMARPPPGTAAAPAAPAADPGGGAPMADLPMLDLTAAERVWLASGPTVRVAYDPDWPPIEFDMDGEVAGLSAAYMRLVSAMAGVEFESVPKDDWPGALAAVRSGEADAILSLARTPDREEFLGFTSPHTVLPWHIVTASPRTIGDTDLGATKVGTIRGYAIEEWLGDNRPDVEFASYGDYDGLLEALRSGEVEAFIEVWPVAAAEAGMAGIEVHSAGQLGEPLSLSAGYSKPNTILGSILQKAIGAVPDDARESALVALEPPASGAAAP